MDYEDFEEILKEIDVRTEAAHRDASNTSWDDRDPDYGVTMTLNEAVKIKNILESMF